MNNIRKRFSEFKNYLSNASDKEREAAITIVKVLDSIPTKKRRKEILKKVCDNFLKTIE